MILAYKLQIKLETLGNDNLFGSNIHFINSADSRKVQPAAMLSLSSKIDGLLG